MAILCGLAAAFSWGVADFLATFVSRRIGATRAQLCTQLLGLLALVGLLAWRGEPSRLSGELWLLGLGLGAVYYAATFSMYRAFEIGTLALVSPVASSYVILTALLAYFAGERASPAVVGGALLLFAGGVLITRPAPQCENAPVANRRGLAEACVTAVACAIVFASLNALTQKAGVLWALLPLRLVNLAGAALALTLTRRRDSTPVSLTGIWPMVLGIALLDSMAWLATTTGLATGQITLVTALTSLFSGITVLLAWLVLREKLSGAQWAGAAVILLGVLLSSF
jgi:drug/metabolite transporter (DMT)-like permease